MNRAVVNADSATNRAITNDSALNSATNRAVVNADSATNRQAAGKFLSVSELNSQLKSLLSAHFGRICVEGEVCNLTKHQSGHYYFSLKDARSVIKCVLFSAKKRLDFALENGVMVQVEGAISIYEPRGEYQIVCSSVRLSGKSALEFEQLKQKLNAEGLFDARHKKPLPPFPRKIALITSKSGAALHDMRVVANKRWNLTELAVFDTLVQGENAKAQIAENIALADNGGFDIIVLARGGGSLEDLWAFNEEIVARAIFAAKTPIVSAIGHEIDFLISDFVADLRAPTPSAAMEMILPDKTEWLMRLADLQNELNNAYFARLSGFANALNLLKTKIAVFRFDYDKLSANLAEFRANLAKNAANMLSRKAESLGTKDALGVALGRFLESKIAQISQLRALLESRNPKRLTQKGFVQITQNGAIVPLKDLRENDKITLSDGEVSKNAIIN